MSLPDRYKYLGLTEEDEPYIRWWMDLGERLGLSYAQRDRGLEIYSRDSRKLPQMTDEQYVAWWESVRAEIGATEGQLNQAMLSGAKVIDSGPESMFNIRPTAAALANERAEIESIMKKDFARYERDREMQRRYQEILEQQAARGVSAHAVEKKRSAEDEQLIAEIEAQMGDPSSAYWQGPRAAAMQAEYRELISSTKPYTGVSENKLRKIELEEMMGDQRGEYWRGPNSQNLQGEYAEIVDSELAALPPPDSATT